MHIEKVHFVGIGGIGMSALAQYFVDHGARVTGSDRSMSPVTEMLEKKGIAVLVPQRAENIPGDAQWVVYSDAVPADNSERVRAEELGIAQCSYFQMLGKVSEGKRTIAIAGTHGKTTTTGMLAKLLIDAGESPTVIVGSIVRDFESNYVHGDSAKPAQSGSPDAPQRGASRDLFVVEACEYKDHLLELSPEMLVITNLEWDHTDYFDSLAALQRSFHKAVLRVPARGAIVTNPNNPNIAQVLEGVTARVIDYTQEPARELFLPGEFNQMNARAAAAAARLVRPDLTNETIEQSLGHFHGTWRRFEYKGKNANGVEVYDDYAHHPTAVRETLHALRERTRGRIFIAFHPHLYSRTRDLFDDFAKAFVDANEVLIAPIYAAREVDDGRVSSETLAGAIAANGIKARAATFAEIETILRKEPKTGDVIMTMGAGDIYKVADKLVQKDVRVPGRRVETNESEAVVTDS